MIDAIELKDVDRDRLRKCEEQTSIMYDEEREGIDEANMTFSYLDLIRLRMLYEWQSTAIKQAQAQAQILKDEALLFDKNNAEPNDDSKTKLEVKLAGDGDDERKFELYKSFEKSLPFADIQLSLFIECV